MTALIQNARGVGVWMSNGLRDCFLDWYADNRCVPGDERWEFCKSDGHRWPGCCIALEDVIPDREILEVSDEELEAAEKEVTQWFRQVLRIIADITTGAWTHAGSSWEAVAWMVPWTSAKTFTTAHAWTDDFFSMKLDLGAPNANVLVTAAEAMWSHPHLQGCWLDSSIEPTARTRLDPRLLQEHDAFPFDSDGPPSLYGFVQIQGQWIVPCMNVLGIGSDYLFIELSMNATALRDVRHPTLGPDGVCGAGVFEWLADVARRVHATTHVKAGVIGWEPTLPTDEELKTRGFHNTNAWGYLVPKDGDLVLTLPTAFTPP